jgi:hypothetical protein
MCSFIIDMERRAAKRVSTSQWDSALEFFKRNTTLIRGYNNSSRARELSQRLWRELADKLNAERSGATKTPKDWAIVSYMARSSRRAIAEVRQRWLFIGWVTKNLLSRALCYGRHVKPLVPAAFAVSTHRNAQDSRGGLWLVLLVIHKEGL